MSINDKSLHKGRLLSFLACWLGLGGLAGYVDVCRQSSNNQQDGQTLNPILVNSS